MARRLAHLLVLAAAILLAAVAPAGGQSSQTVPSIELGGTVDPATEGWIGSALADAGDDGAPLAIIRIDTPGGLETSMREIIGDVIEAPMPVVVFVTPNGARAASAGAFITESADVAAMSQQTNIGSASAVTSTGEDIGGTLELKIENDAAAFIRALAESHDRNGDVAGRMVTEAANFTAEEALDAGAIDLIADDDEDLLAALDGFEVAGPKAQTLATAGLEIDEREMPLSYEILQLLVNPTVAYLLLLIGFVGIAIEFFSPGAILPGAVGVTSLLLGLFGSAQLPLTAAGVALLVIGVILILVETQTPTHGIIGIIGVGALAGSGLLLFDTGDAGLEVSVPVVITVAVLLGGFVLFAAHKALAARHGPVASGPEELVGRVAEVREPLGPVGQVFVDGALWRARLADGVDEADAGQACERGARVRIVSLDGLTLIVRPVDPANSDREPEE